MVKYTEINKAIVQSLKSKFENIKVISTDVKEGIIRPSFFVELDNIKATDFMNESLDRAMTARIYYFSQDKYKNKIELLKVQDDLSDLFLTNNILEIDEFTKVEIEELDFNVIDKVLHCYFEIKLNEDYNRVDNVENMDELEIKNI